MLTLLKSSIGERWTRTKVGPYGVRGCYSSGFNDFMMHHHQAPGIRAQGHGQGHRGLVCGER